MTQQYVGTKIVTAWEQDKDGQPGYAVKYADGYISWSPKAQFEDAYLALGHVEHLAPHEQRLLAEKAELADRLSKLNQFICQSPIFADLGDRARQLLREQRDTMMGLHEILDERCEALDVA